MNVIQVTDFDDWRGRARNLLRREVSPSEVIFHSADDGPSLFSSSQFDVESAGSSIDERKAVSKVPARFMELAREVACHSRSDRWNLLYRILWRTTHGEPSVLQDATDEDVAAFHSTARAVSNEIHHVHAFVRFQRITEHGEDQYVAWIEPSHAVLPLAVPFFVKRFANMKWAILTPMQSVFWDRHQLHWGPGATRQQGRGEDQELNDLWDAYYVATFNPARAKVQQRIPMRYWPSMPETNLIPALVANAANKTTDFVEAAPRVNAMVPQTDSLEVLAVAAKLCRACELCERATQTVFGTGSSMASLVLVGEQPGDEEDRLGQPFVGPAGKVLDEALAEAGLDRKNIYLTNAVKHFHWQPRGKRRLHQRPTSRHMAACQPWLEAEIQVVQPRVLVCLGNTATQAVFGHRRARQMKRGRFESSRFCQVTMMTWHPAAILRAQNSQRTVRFRELVQHLGSAVQEVQETGT